MRHFYITLLLLGLMTPAFAYGPYGDPYESRLPPAPPESVQLKGPSQILRESFTQLRSLFQQGRPNKSAVERFVDAKLTPYFDFDYMTKWAGGPLYKQSNPHHRSKMIQHVRQSFLSTLVKHMASYDSQDFKVLKEKPGRSDKEITVTTWIKKARGRPLKVNFRFYFNGRDWKVFDVTANGNSAIIQYRKYFKRKYKRQQNRRW